jgi:putative transposase
LPKSIVDALGAERADPFPIVGSWLDRCEGATPLSSSDHAKCVVDSLRFFDGSRYRLMAWCVMPNHVHVVATWLPGFRVGDTVRSWKAFSAAKINRAMGKRGRFWAPDYFDRYMRDEDDLAGTISYVERNPVAAGLVQDPSNWPWSSARRPLDRAPSGAP